MTHAVGNAQRGEFPHARSVWYACSCSASCVRRLSEPISFAKMRHRGEPASCSTAGGCVSSLTSQVAPVRDASAVSVSERLQNVRRQLVRRWRC